MNQELILIGYGNLPILLFKILNVKYSYLLITLLCNALNSDNELYRTFGYTFFPKVLPMSFSSWTIVLLRL